MQSILRFGIFDRKAPWASERPVGEVRERAPRVALGVLVAFVPVAMAFRNHMRLVGGYYDAGSRVIASYLFIMLLVLVGVKAFDIIAGDSWRACVRSRVGSFGRRYVTEYDGEYDPWEGVRYDNAPDDWLPGLSMEGWQGFTLYAAALTQAPDPMTGVVSLSLVDDEGELLRMVDLPDPQGAVDQETLREAAGTGVSLFDGIDDKASVKWSGAASAVYAATKLVSFQPVTVLAALDMDAYVFDLRAVNVLDECASLGIEEASDRRLTSWQRLLRCSQRLGVESAPTKQVAMSTALAARLCREVHEAANELAGRRPDSHAASDLS